MPEPLPRHDAAGAVEALADVFRAVPAIPLIGEPARAVDTYRDYDAWSRHFLTGAPPPGVRSVADGPQWAQARLFFRERRQAEQTLVQRREREYGALAQDLLAALREVSGAAGEAAGSMDATLDRVQALLASNAVEQLRAEFTGMAAQLRTLMATQRADFERQLHDLRMRVQAAEQAANDSEHRAQELGQHVSDLRDALDDARERMQIDPLTGLYHRGAFDAALAHYVELAKASGQKLTLVLLDMDHFKRINDSFGHAAGDAVLRAFGGLLSRAFLRADDFVARYGGEEFAALLFVNDASQVERLVAGVFERLHALRLPELVDGDALACSAGYALLQSDEDPRRFFKRADAALYQAKAAGRDRLMAAA
jgi:diguanylate cyclase (GGDEF)-like protein